MASRRRIGHLIGGMRLGDMAAALEGRRMRRAEQRDTDEREARRLQAANMSLSQVLGALGQFGERQDANARLAKQDARQARLDKAAEAERKEMSGFRQSEEKRRQSDFERRKLSDLMASLEPGTRAAADESLDRPIVGGLEFDLSSGQVAELDPEQARLEDLVAPLVDSGIPRAEAESIARGALKGAKGGRAQAALVAGEEARRNRVADSQVAENEAQAAAARRRGRGGGATSTKTPMPGKANAPILPDQLVEPYTVRTPASTLQEWTDANHVQSLWRDAIAEIERVDPNTGWVPDKVNALAKKLGIDDKQYTTLKGLLDDLADMTLRDRSGAAAPIQEQSKIKSFQGATNMDEDTMLAMAKQFAGNHQRRLGLWGRNLYVTGHIIPSTPNWNPQMEAQEARGGREQAAGEGEEPVTESVVPTSDEQQRAAIQREVERYMSAFSSEPSDAEFDRIVELVMAGEPVSLREVRRAGRQ